MNVKGVGKGGDGTELPSSCRPLISGVARGWTGVDMSTPLLLEVAPEIDTNPTSFYRGRGRGVAPLPDPCYRLALRARHVRPPHIF